VKIYAIAKLRADGRLTVDKIYPIYESMRKYRVVADDNNSYNISDGLDIDDDALFNKYFIKIDMEELYAET